MMKKGLIVLSLFLNFTLFSFVNSALAADIGIIIRSKTDFVGQNVIYGYS